MKLIKSSLLALATLMTGGLAWADTYDPATNRLTVDSVQVGDTVYTNVVITVGTIHSVGGSYPANSPVTETCTASNFTKTKFDTIAVGMTAAQISQIMGCKNDPASTQRGSNHVVYVWKAVGSFTYIMVWFDVNGAVVTRLHPDPVIPYKQAVGF